MDADEMNNTVVAVFVEGRKLLMDQRSKSKKVYAGFLMCPSGHIEHEPIEDAMKREMKEELGINVEKSKFLFTIDDIDPFSKLEFRHNFMLIESYNGLIEKSRESDGLQWMTYDQIIKVRPVLIVRKLANKLKEMKIM